MRRTLTSILMLVICFALFGCSAEKYEWNEVLLKEHLPTPSSTEGKIGYNSETQFRVSVHNMENADYQKYVELCKQFGYVREAEENTYSYVAYDDEGYKLILSYYSDSKNMDVSLEAPMELGSINWPSSDAAQRIPIPKSSVGKLYWENSDGFVIYIGDTPLDTFNSYVDECIDAGFDVDYSRGDDYYYADDGEGYELYLNYRGNNLMSVHLECPDESNNVATESVEIDESEEKEVVKGKELIDGIVDEYNQIAPMPISNMIEVDVTDKSGEHYRTEFRLAAFEGSYAQSGNIGDVSIDIVAYGYGENDEIRVYACGLSLEQAIEIIKYISPIIDKDITALEMQDALEYVQENEEANGYYYGDLGLVLLGKYSDSYELMIKYE